MLLFEKLGKPKWKSRFQIATEGKSMSEFQRHWVRKESVMLRQKAITRFAAFLGALVAFVGSAHAADIGGTISSTLTITEDSQLVDDVTCTVAGAPCITFGASGLTLELNGFSLTGQGDPQTGCLGASTAGEIGILANGLKDVIIRGPGRVEQFRNFGIQLLNTTGGTIADVTVATNCMSGIFVSGGSANNVVERNVSLRNGHLTAACGGI